MMSEAGTRPRSLRERGFLSAGPVDVDCGVWDGDSVCNKLFPSPLLCVHTKSVVSHQPAPYNQQVQMGAARPQTNRKIDKTY